MEQEIRFGALVLDRLRCELRGPARTLRIDQKACDVLTLLIECRERAVPRGEILSRVWPGVTVSDSSVAVQVHAIRDAFKRAGCGEEPIRTLKAPARYQFCLAVDEVVETPLALPPVEAIAPEMRSRRRRFATSAVAGGFVVAAVAAAGIYASGLFQRTAAPPLSIVVKPFRNLSSDREKDYLADAITDDLTAEFGHIPFIIVIARSTAQTVNDRQPQEIGRLLHVRYLLEGSLRPEGQTYHVIVSLVDAATAVQIWSAQFDQAPDRLSEIRQTIVSHVASALHLALDRIASDRAAIEDAGDPTAQDLFLRARSILDYGHDLASFQVAQGLLERARLKAPTAAAINAELGWTLIRKVTSLDDPDDETDFSRAKQVTGDALKADQGNELALTAHALILATDSNCSEAERILRGVLETYPNAFSARSVVGTCAIRDARFEEVVSTYRRLIALDPDGPKTSLLYLPLGSGLLMLGRYREAEAALRSCLMSDQPYDRMGPLEQCRLLHVAALQLNGRDQEAEAEYKSYARHTQGRTLWRFSGYFPQTWIVLPAFRALQGALAAAGMPRYAGEDDNVSQDNMCGPGDFAATPDTLPGGGKVLHTADVVALLGNPVQPLWIDAGARNVVISSDALRSGASDIAGLLGASSGRDNPTRQQILRAKSIVVFGDGVSGCESYRVAVALIDAGVKTVAWYRGGKEAWTRHIVAVNNDVTKISAE